MMIAEVSKHVGRSPHTLGSDERIGLIPPVTRNKKGIRDYREMDRNGVQFILCMGSAGIPRETLIDCLFQQGAAPRETRKAILKAQREQIAARIGEMPQALGKLEYKIAHYDDIVFPVESNLR